MYVVTILLFLVLLLITLMALVPLKAVITINSEELPGYHTIFTWLNPLFKGKVSKVQEDTILQIYLLNKKIITKTLNGKTTDMNGKLRLIRELEPHFIKFEASYSFTDPSYTGMVCGVINMIPQYVDVDDLDNHPDFSSYSEYFNVNAVAEMNVLLLISGYRKLNKRTGKVQLQH